MQQCQKRGTRIVSNEDSRRSGERKNRLKADRQTTEQRLAHRTGHFMNPTLIGSQFEALQQPRNAVVVNATEPVDEVVKRIRSALDI
jgi:gluconate kinase